MPCFSAHAGCAVVAHLSCAQVKGLQFNPSSPNLLASGAADGELCIWDLASPGSPSLYPALKGGGSAAGAGEVTFLAWNCRVAHIVASTSAGGTTVVWDLKRQRPVISFTDPAGARRCSAIAWNPEVATQLITASDDDRSPELQVWDLRNSISPAAVWRGHAKGVLAMAWSGADASLLLTCGKDNRTLVWDAPSGAPVAELPASTNWNFDVHWAPQQPGLLSAASFDGKVGIYNLLEAAPAGASGPQEGVPPGGASLPRAPAWLRRPSGACFGFGGVLVSFCGGSRECTLRTVPLVLAGGGAGLSDAQAAEEEAFQAAVAASDREGLKAFCASQAAAAEAAAAEGARPGDDAAAHDAETWHFLRILLDGDNARRLLLRHLQYEDTGCEGGEAPAGGSAPAPADAPGGPLSARSAGADKPRDSGAVAATPGSTPGGARDDAADFFENLGDTPKSDAPEPPKSAPASPERAAEPEANGCGEAEPSGADASIQRALVVGDYPAAVAACLACGRLGDALVLASVGGTELWLKTQGEYMRRAPRPYLRVVAAVVRSDLGSLVRTSRPAAWRETLALLCTYAPSAQWGALAAQLADTLAAARMAGPALLCRVCAGDTDGVVRVWAAGVVAGDAGQYRALRDCVHKAVVLAATARATREAAPPAPALVGVVSCYAELLGAQGRPDAAAAVLALVPGEDSAEGAALRQRILPHAPGRRAQQAPAPGAGAGAQPPSGYGAYAPAAPPRTPAPPPPHPAGGHALYAPPPPAVGYAPPPGVHGAARAPQPPHPAHPPPQPAPALYAPAPPPTGGGPPPQAQAPPAVRPPPASAPAPAYAPPPVYGAGAPVSAVPVPPAALASSSPPPTLFAPAGGGHAQAHRFSPSAAAPPGAGPAPQHVAAPPLSSAAAGASAAAAGPPASLTLESVDTSGAPASARPVVASLLAVYGVCAGAAGATPAKRRELEDTNRRLAALLWRLVRADVSQGVVAKLGVLCAALDRADWGAAVEGLVQLTSTDWDECAAWLPALKRLIKSRSTM